MLFAISGAALVGLTFLQTQDDIKHNEKITLLNKSILTQESFSIYRYIHRGPAIWFYAEIIDPRLEKNKEV